MSDTTLPPAQPSAPPPGRSPGRGLKIALFVSLAFNLLIVGLVAGAILRFQNAPWRSYGPDPLMQLFAADLAAGDRSAWRERAPERSAERVARLRALSAALRAEPFSPERVEALMAEERGAMAERVEAAHARFLDRIGGLSASQRGAFADRLDRLATRAAPRSGDRP
jgi:hypothetical protein